MDPDNQLNQPIEQSRQDDSMQTFLPTKNKYSLISYYLGFAAIVPFIGFWCAIGAIIYASKAMKLYSQNPTPGAKGHATVGKTLGIIMLVLHILFTLLLIVPIIFGLFS